MSDDPQVLTTLRRKRDELENLIAAYKIKIEGVHYELMHLNATIAMFELNGEAEIYPTRMDISRVFKRGEMFRLANVALADAPNGLDTREVALAVIRAKGLDERDALLRKTINYRVSQALRMRCLRGHIANGGRRKGVRVWRCVSPC